MSGEILPSAPASASRGNGWRRAVDLLAVLIGGVLAFPLLLGVGIAAGWTLGQPVFFTQARAGLNGRSFTLYKFRTMSDARDASGALLPDAARTPPMGHFLRRTRLDELPQFLNLARGDVSLVGPRPLLPETVASFGEAGKARGAVRPGVTGWSQVNGNTLLTNDDKLALDLWYIDHRSPLLDALILFKTLVVVLAGEAINTSNLEKARAHALRRYRIG